MESLKEKTAKGLFWGALNNVMLQVIGVTMGIVMGRLLNATDYGMMAMISIFALVANDLQNSGFKAALNNIKQPQHRDYNSVFWFNIAMGAGLYVLLFFLAPLIASYYHTPELIPLCRYAFLSLIFSSFGIIRTGDPHSASIGNPLGTCSSSAASCCSPRYSPTSTTTS